MANAALAILQQHGQRDAAFGSFFPDALRLGSPMPPHAPRRGLILAYHGFQSSPWQFRLRSKLDEVAASLDFAIEFMPSAAGVWYWFGDSPFAQRMYRRQAGEMIAAVRAYQQAGLPRALVGFSAGGNLVTRLGVEFPAELSAVFAHAAELRVTPWCHPVGTEHVPAIFTGNVNDPLVPPHENAELLKAWWGSAARFELGPEGHDPVLGGHCWLPAWNNPMLEAFLRGLP